MVKEDGDDFGEFKVGEDVLEPEEKVEEEDDVVSGENYYSSVSSFHVYEGEFSTYDAETTDTQKYEKLCESFSNVLFSNSYPKDRCYKVAKYLHSIKLKTDENTDDRCKFLNYLLNTKEDFKTLEGYDVSKLLIAYNKLSSRIKICYNNIEHIKNEHVLEKIKNLYDLNKAVDKLENSVKSDKENISKNAEEFAEIYQKIRNNYPTDNSDVYCRELKVFEQYIYHCTKSEEHREAWKILKTLIPNDGTFIIVSCIMIFGIPFFSYILYNFTPLGSWVNTQIRKRINMWNNLPENESQLHIPDHDQLNMENSKFNIKYQSA
ncbi:PIR Superfamily Protein [Plasmodium ovale curtisi]|uniref:PIR Superfamily Protein n=1 Tax=Plasmodium ovale curtisi TaxID=864141 RepID=A0A1A8WQH5_PLAOA|nr:PIR Superfamily Protein [Plasmodium ovale curtisi]